MDTCMEWTKQWKRYKKKDFKFKVTKLSRFNVNDQYILATKEAGKSLRG